jgi:hypothetical protein
VHLVGFIIKKFVSMHGNMNIKFTMYMLRGVVTVHIKLKQCGDGVEGGHQKQ